MPDVNQLISDPSYLAYKFDFATESIEFISLAKDDLSKATWLTREALGGDKQTTNVPLIDVIKSINSLPEPSRKSTRFIFHTAYCASTFLSRCLDVRGFSVSLREPHLLLDAANAKRLQWRSKTCNMDFRHLPALALRLLQKHAEPNERLLIKPVNSVNNIIPELLQASGSTKSLMMYTDARNFLLSTLKKGEEAKQRQRAMFDLIRCDFPHLSQLGLSDVIHMSDLKICLTLWRLQIEQAEQILSHFAPTTAMTSLYAESLIRESNKALRATNKFLELGVPDEMIESIAQSDLSTRDAKNASTSFSIEKREAGYREIEKFFAADLENGYNWLTNNNPSTSLTPALSGALNIEKSLMEK